METATASPSGGRAARGRSPTCSRSRSASTAPKRASYTRTNRRRWVSATYAEVGEIVRRLSLGLIELGSRRATRSRSSRTRARSGPTSTSPRSPPGRPSCRSTRPTRRRSASTCSRTPTRVVIVEDDEQLEKVRAVRDRCPKLEHVIRMTGQRRRDLDGGARRARRVSEPEWEERWSSVAPDDICTFIYTSGTTGPPKGCVISHGNYRSMLDMSLEQSVLERRITYLFLPLAHSFALLIQFGTFDLGARSPTGSATR